MFLAAVTIAVFGIKAVTRHHHSPSKPKASTVVIKRYYVVRAGDTLASVAAKTGVPVARLRQLNPKLQTTLFLGERIKLK